MTHHLSWITLPELQTFDQPRNIVVHVPDTAEVWFTLVYTLEDPLDQIDLFVEDLEVKLNAIGLVVSS